MNEHDQKDLLAGASELYALLMQVPAAIAVFRGREYTCVFQNTEARKLVDHHGRTLREMWPDNIEAQTAIFDRVIATGRIHVEREVEAHTEWVDAETHQTRYWDATYAPLRLSDGRIDGVIVIVFEVTDVVLARRHAAEADAARATAQARLHAALRAAEIGTYAWEIHGDHVEHDEGIRRLYGFGPGEGFTLADYTARIHPEDRLRFEAALERSAHAEADFELEYRVVWPDGSVRWLLDQGGVVRDDHDARSFLVGAVIDITESKRLADEALAANRAKDEFLAMLGHELRNPLAPIMTAVELTKMRGDPMTKELETIERQVHHLSRLVDDLLDISRITSGRLELHRERVAVRTAIDRAIELASPLLEQKQHRLKVTIEHDLEVIGDPVRLAQIFSNLLNNAARYTPAGGDVAIQVTSNGPRAVIRVIDNGIGIPAELRDRMFAPFVQGVRGVARSEGGLGLGLALVHSLVQLHGGTVTAHSAGTGRGSELVVELPIAPEDTRTRDEQAARDARDTRRVLVVDDNVDAAELISELLRHLGHDVQIAHDGPEALRVADRFHPEVAVLDIGLPVMDGYELARRLSQREEHVRLIALTGYGQASDRARSRDAGFAVHMIKPVDMRALAKALVA